MLLTQNIKSYYATESGRSMIEMLGVLAIIGVLSIAGIAGYKYAIDKYYVNETMEELNSRAVTYAMQILTDEIENGEVLSNGEFGDTTALGYTIEANKSYYPHEFEVTMTNYPSEVCRGLLKNYTIPFQIVVSERVYDPISSNISICGDGETAPETLFIFKTDLNLNKAGLEESSYYYYEGTARVECVSGEEFKSYGTCYSCDSEGSYVIGTEEELALCRACGRRMAVNNRCVPGCMAGQIYHAGQNKCITPGCQTNSDCGSNEYCKLDDGQNDYSCEDKPLSGTCESVGSTTPVTVVGVGKYIKSSSEMNWWNAQNYCSAIGGRMATVSDLGCGYDFVGAGAYWGYCNAEVGNKDDNKPLSANMQAFQTAFGKLDEYWLSDEYNSCKAYYASLGSGGMSNYDRYGSEFALCRVGN